MKKIFLMGLLVAGFAFAKENYSEMSTQELIEIIGFVDEKDKSAFHFCPSQPKAALHSR